MKCKLCKSKNVSLLYRGPIRKGAFAKIGYVKGYLVYGCHSCRTHFLHPFPRVDYSSGSYHKDIFGALSAKVYYRLRKKEQSEYLKIIGKRNVKDKIVCDVGSACGVFLDLVKGIAKKTIAVEPCQGYRQILKRKGHEVFSSMDEVLDKYGKGQIDFVSSFHVIEHTEDPFAFLRQIRSLLKKGGISCIATLNNNEILMELKLEAYKSFYYRIAHPWYFGEKALRLLLESSGFLSYKIIYKHKLDMSNFATWLKDGKPSINKRYLDLFDESIDSAWKDFLEKNGMAYEICALARKQ